MPPASSAPPQDAGTLSPKRRRFVSEYLCDLNATQAAIRAGYSPRTAKVQAARLLTKADIQAAVAVAMAARSQRTEITADAVVRELARVGFVDMRRLMRWGADSVAFVPSDELSPDDAAAVAWIEADTTCRRADGGTEKTVKLKLKLHDKIAALSLLGRHLGMFTEKLPAPVGDLTVRVVYVDEAVAGGGARA